MKNKIKIAAVQMKVLSAKTNLPKILNYIELAGQAKVDIVGFPECSLNPSTKKPSSKKDLAVIQDACFKNAVHVIINGYFCENNKVFNRTYVIDDNGEILDSYDKIYLWTTELGGVDRGDQVKVVETKFGKIGLCTCWDIFFPEMIGELKRQGAEIIFCPSYWNDNIKKESCFLESAPVTYAYLNMVYFVYCNALLKGKTSISQIASPWGKLSEIKYKEGMIAANIYNERLKRFKKHFENVLWGRKI